jgi:hypothetical protein
MIWKIIAITLIIVGIVLDNVSATMTGIFLLLLANDVI